MTSRAVIENKISSIRKYLSLLEYFKQFKASELEGRIELKGAVERYLYLVVQSTIDLAEAVISFRSLRKPTTMAETFRILAEEQLLSTEVAARLVRMVGFRNILAHDYETVNFTIVYEILHHRLGDIEDVLKALLPILN